MDSKKKMKKKHTAHIYIVQRSDCELERGRCKESRQGESRARARAPTQMKVVWKWRIEEERKVCCLSSEMDAIQQGKAEYVALVATKINTWIWHYIPQCVRAQEPERGAAHICLPRTSICFTILMCIFRSFSTSSQDYSNFTHFNGMSLSWSLFQTKLFFTRTFIYFDTHRERKREVESGYKTHTA